MTDRGAALLALAVVVLAVALWSALTNRGPEYTFGGPSSAILLERSSGRTWLFVPGSDGGPGWRALRIERDAE